MSTELVSKINDLGTAIGEIKSNLGTRLGELERRVAGQDGGGGHAAGQSLGELVTSHADVRAMSSDFRGKATLLIDRAAITTADTTVGAGRSSATSLVPSQRLPGIVTPPERRLTARDLIPAAETTSGSIEFARETGYTLNARPVEEGTLKPESHIQFNMETAHVRTIAHTLKTSRQMLDDAPALRAYIDQRAHYGIQLKEEQQLYFGDGTGQNLPGLVPQARAYDASRNKAGDTALDVLLNAVSMAEEAELPASGIVLSVRDWRALMGIRDKEGRYLSEGPFGTTAPRIWGLDVISSNSFTSGQFLVGAFSSGAQIFDRLKIEVLLSSENNDDFERNMFTIRAEERLALAVYRPEAFVTGSLYPTE